MSAVDSNPSTADLSFIQQSTAGPYCFLRIIYVFVSIIGVVKRLKRVTLLPTIFILSSFSGYDDPVFNFDVKLFHDGDC